MNNHISNPNCNCIFCAILQLHILRYISKGVQPYNGLGTTTGGLVPANDYSYKVIWDTVTKLQQQQQQERQQMINQNIPVAIKVEISRPDMRSLGWIVSITNSNGVVTDVTVYNDPSRMIVRIAETLFGLARFDSGKESYDKAKVMISVWDPSENKTSWSTEEEEEEKTKEREKRAIVRELAK